VRAWLSGIDGSGSRAAWILFEGPYGGGALCSLILNDVVGITEVAGGEITKRRLEAELASLRAAQKLPWVETEPARAVGLVAEGLQIHRERGTSPPSEFGRWQPFFAQVVADPLLLARSAELLALPEMAGWFLDPETVQSDALEIQEARQSRLVVSDQIKAERQEAILARVVEREFAPAARRRWARRLAEMSWIFSATGRPEPAATASAAAAAFAESDAEPLRHPFARALAQRALELASEVAAGRLSASDVSRKP
jgi:hypothetical protein